MTGRSLWQFGAASIAATALLTWAGSSELAHTTQSVGLVQPFSVNIRGVLRDDRGTPLVERDFGVTITDNGRRHGRTDKAGAFLLRDITVRPGHYDLVIEVEGLTQRKAAIDVPAGANGAVFTIDVRLGAAPGSRSPASDASPAGSAPPSPPPPSPPASASTGGREWTGHSPSAPANVPALIWNSWAERHDDGSVQNNFAVVDVVGTRDSVLVTLDLSGIEYAPYASAALSRSAGPDFRKHLATWLSGVDTMIPLRAVVVADPAYFENPYLTEHPFDVQLDRIRSFDPPSQNPFTLLRLDSDAAFRFGHVSVPLTTRGRSGWAPISITLWTAGGRPIEEVPFSVCISKDPTKPAAAACPGPRPTRTTLGGFDALRAARGETADPDVAVHILSMPGNNEVYGVMATRSSPNKIAWPIEGGAEELRAALAGPMFRLLADASSDDAWLLAGRQLRNLLFPVDAPEDPGSHFDQAIRDAIDAGNRPSVYVRMLQTPAAPFIFPIGAISIGDELLGLQSDLEIPLPSQAYAVPGACVNQWALVAPPPGSPDPALKDARDAADPILGQWTDVSWPFNTIREFGEWMVHPPSELQAPAGIFVLSHHEDDILRFNADDKIAAAVVVRKLPEPSIVVLNACGGARTSSQDFVTRFNVHGATSIVTTITEVEAAMAGTFAACWTTEMGQIPPEGLPVGEVFARARRCVYDVKDDTGGSRWGAKVLKYVLLGDASTRLCPIR